MLFIFKFNFNLIRTSRINQLKFYILIINMIQNFKRIFLSQVTIKVVELILLLS